MEVTFPPFKIHAGIVARAYESASVRIVGKDCDILVSPGLPRANIETLARLTCRFAAPVWHFAVSGDSRNCGDVVMPSIAAAARANQATRCTPRFMTLQRGDQSSKQR